MISPNVRGMAGLRFEGLMEGLVDLRIVVLQMETAIEYREACDVPSVCCKRADGWEIILPPHASVN